MSFKFLAVSPGDQPKPLYAQLFKSGGRSSETHTEAPPPVSVQTQNYSSPLPKATSPVYFCFDFVLIFNSPQLNTFCFYLGSK